jgi:hypothetical protein
LHDKEPNQKKLIALPVKALDFTRSNNQGSPVAKYSPRAAQTVLAMGGG